MSAPRKYPDELRERVVRQVRESGRPIAHIAEDLGVHREALRLWVRQAESIYDETRDYSSTFDDFVDAAFHLGPGDLVLDARYP